MSAAAARYWVSPLGGRRAATDSSLLLVHEIGAWLDAAELRRLFVPRAPLGAKDGMTSEELDEIQISLGITLPDFGREADDFATWLTKQ